MTCSNVREIEFQMTKRDQEDGTIEKLGKLMQNLISEENY